MNKSILTNIICLSLVIIGHFVGENGQILIESGIFALSGAITNWFAVYMLFEKIPGLYGSGIIPSRFEEFKNGIKSMLMNQFFTDENIHKFLGNSKNFKLSEEQKSLVFNGLVSAVMKSPLGGMLGMFGGEAALDSIKPSFNTEIDNVIKKIMANDDSISKIQIETIVDSRLNELTPLKVKKIIENMIREHLGWLVVWGGVFGALIGFARALL